MRPKDHILLANHPLCISIGMCIYGWETNVEIWKEMIQTRKLKKKYFYLFG